MKKIYRVSEAQLETILNKKKIHKLGHDANREHKGLDANPYEKDTIEHKTWVDGWLGAEAKSQADHDESELKKEIGEDVSETEQPINEVSEDTYRVNCKVSLDYYDAKLYNGGPVDYIKAEDIFLTYNLDIKYKEYGMMPSVYNVNAQSPLMLTVTHYPEGSEDSAQATFELPIDNDMITLENTDDISYIGLDNVIDVTLSNDAEGNIVIVEIKAYKKDLA